jgi:hypothetical protein
VVRTVAPYFGCPAFKYRHEDQLTWLTSFPAKCPKSASNQATIAVLCALEPIHTTAQAQGHGALWIENGTRCLNTQCCSL